MSDLILENDHLKSSLSLIKQVIDEEQSDIKVLSKIAKGNDDVWQTIFNKEYKVKKLSDSLSKPYFARIDFKRDDEDNSNSFYIGRRGVSKEGNIIITDWRAPVSSLYYDSEVGICSFNSPEGIVNGNMLLKRQFEIDDGKLINYFDVNLVTGDKLLQKYLQANNDNRLTSIVATIQKEQNDVIRRRIDENIIVQGVAGSGKTTVALHKIAYLVYNYSKTINEDKYLVIGPNPVFLKYIRNVLPDLDVSGVTQYTFEDFAKSFINEDIIINDSFNKANLKIDGKNNNDIDKFKSSMKYKAMLDQFIDNYINSLNQNDLKIGDFIVVNSHIIKRLFNEVDNSYTFNNRIEHVIKRLTKFIHDNNAVILNNYTDYADSLFVDSNNKELLKKKFAKEREIIKKGCKNEIRNYFASAKASPTKLYKNFIESITNYNIFDYDNLDNLKRETLSYIRKKSYDFEDLAALMYLKKKLIRDEQYSKYRHIVIDEAQDFGEFNFYILKTIFDNATFSIFGDLAQSIYDYRSINSWDRVNSIMFNNSATIVSFNKSYRTTRQIMNVADNIAIKLGLNKSDLVLREGNPVKFISDVDNKEIYIINRINELKNIGYKTIAVISKTEEMSIKLNSRLKLKGLDIPNIMLDDDLNDSRYNVCTISNGLAKGLEFDAVIISDASNNIYKDNSLDMKLLYVAITRALHSLDIIYDSNIAYQLEE